MSQRGAEALVGWREVEDCLGWRGAEVLWNQRLVDILVS